MRENLRTPPELAPGTLRVTPLGGCGDVGRNMTSFEIDGRILLVDAGVLFPDDSQPGVDLILPGLHLISDRLNDIEALILTHGHEDHIGAVPYLLRRRPNIPILGTRLTLALVRSKLKEHGIRNHDLREVADGEHVTLGGFACEFLPVNHSIPDAVAVVITTRGGTVLHSGDFKMDQLPLDKRLTDLRGFARAGEKGVDLMLVDSTNAETPGSRPPRSTWPRPWNGLREGVREDHRGLLQLARAPGAAGARPRPPPAARCVTSAARWSAT